MFNLNVIKHRQLRKNVPYTGWQIITMDLPLKKFIPTGSQLITIIKSPSDNALSVILSKEVREQWFTTLTQIRSLMSSIVNLIQHIYRYSELHINIY